MKSDREQAYDTEIAPELLRLAKRCQELGFPAFIASVEWDTGETGRTDMVSGGDSPSHLKQQMVHWAARCECNVDRLIFAMLKHAEKHGHSSVCLQVLGCKNVKYYGTEMAAIAISRK